MLGLETMKTLRESAQHEIRALLVKDDKTAEERRRIDRLQGEVKALDFQIADLEKRALIPRQEQPGAGMPSADSEEKRAFSQWVRTGHTERRDLLTTGAGATFVPESFYPVLTEAQKAWGPLLPLLNQQMTDDGRPQKMAFADDTANSLHESGEPATIAETDPSTSGDTVTPLTLDTGIIKVSVQELQDSAFDIDQFVQRIFGQRYYRGLTAKVTNGSTAAGIESIITGAHDGPTSAAGATVDYDDIVALYKALDPAYRLNATWTMNSNTQGLLLGVKDGFNRPLYVPSPSSGGFDTLLGRPVVLNQSMADVALNSRSIQFGDYKAGYLLRTVRPGLAIVRLNERFMDTLEVGFIGYCRVSGKVTDAGTHPIVNLKQAAA